MTAIGDQGPAGKAPFGLIDTHCHLTHSRFAADRDAVLTLMRAANMGRAITIGTGTSDARAALELAAAHPDLLSVAAGLDPFSCQELGAGFADGLQELDDLLAAGGCVALGEIGLEYFHTVNPHDVQRRQLDAQLALAIAHDLPVVIHVRDAHPDMRAALAAHPQARGVIHSFSGGPAEAEGYLALGWHLSFNGIATFPKAPELRDAARITPRHRLLLETDAPFLAPVPHRGQRCEPIHVAATLAVLAAERGEDPADLGAQAAANARHLFRLPA